MENPTSFDLNVAVQSWRQGLAASPSLTTENLDELESHLRDGVEKLQPIGLSLPEAFMVARARIGSADRLDVEFAKADPERLWVNRIKWMVAGVLTLNLVNMTCGIAGGAVTYLSYWGSSLFGFQTAAYLPGRFNLFVSAIVGAASVAGFIRVAKTQSSNAKRIGELCHKNPIAVALAAIVIYTVMVVLQYLVNFYNATHLSRHAYSDYSRTREVLGVFAYVLTGPALLAWLFVHVSRQTASK